MGLLEKLTFWLHFFKNPWGFRNRKGNDTKQKIRENNSIMSFFELKKRIREIGEVIHRIEILFIQEQRQQLWQFERDRERERRPS